MFHIKPEHVRRISFASKLFPKIKSSIGLDLAKLKSSDKFDGELFCGGRSKNKDLLTFFNFIASDQTNNLASFIQLPTFRRSLRKLINIVENEIELIGGQEVLMPTIVPEKLWKKSKRLERQSDALDSVFKFTDNSGTKLLLGPTFEETITKLVGDLESLNESELPLLLYQTSTKFRYEPNPRFGLLRSYEFFMNDLYSFDSNLEQASRTYQLIGSVYDKIFQHLGLSKEVKKILSETGDIGGKYSHEYQLPVSSGEDTILECDNCGHAINMEMTMRKGNNGEICTNCQSTNVRKSKALELAHTFLLSDVYSKPFKAKYTSTTSGSGTKDNRHFLEMGCYGLGLTRIIGAGIDLLSIVPTSLDKSQEDLVQLRWPDNIEPFKIGLVAPAKRSKQHNAGSSEFIEKLANRILETTKNVDIIIEDRDREGIGRRLLRLQSMGIPNILVVGQRFLQEEPEVELLKLDAGKINYQQHWFTQDLLCDFIKSKMDTLGNNNL